MATLFEYFKKDQGRSLTLDKDLEIKEATGKTLLKIKGRLHTDFEANALYISFYIPLSDSVESPARIVLNAIDEVISWRREVFVQGGFPGQEPATNSECLFTGRIYIYSELPIANSDKEYINTRAAELGHSVKFRGRDYANERNRHDRPHAFISHDSRDKELIAGPLALEMQRLLCPVWYDEYSLKVGDSLREQIEKGLKECKKCILVLTPNYLSNEGWGKKEFDSVFTRELVEREQVILPVWYGVTKKDVYKYSPALADRVAANWQDGAAAVAKKLKQALE